MPQQASAATSGQAVFYFRSENPDASTTANTLSLTPPADSVNTVLGGANGYQAGVNYPNGNPGCELGELMIGNTGNQIAIDSDNGTVKLGDTCIASFYSLPVGQAISVETTDSSSIDWSMYFTAEEDGSPAFSGAVLMQLYKWDGTAGISGYTLFASSTGAYVTTAQTNASTSAIATPSANVTFAAGDRIVAVVSGRIRAADSSGGNDNYAVLFDQRDSPSHIRIKYTILTPSKPDLTGSRDDDFTTGIAEEDCTNSGLNFLTKWTCATETGTTLGSVRSDVSGHGSSTHWLILRDKEDGTLGADMSENTMLYQTVDTNSDGDGSITTVVNVNSPAAQGTSPYSHSGLALFVTTATTTDYISVEAAYDGTNRGVALNQNGTLSDSTALTLY